MKPTMLAIILGLLFPVAHWIADKPVGRNDETAGLFVMSVIFALVGYLIGKVMED